MHDRDAVDAVRHAALWFTPSEDGLSPLLDLIGDARLVLIGEATHGTEEFYRIRANLTSALIRTKQFNVVAAEADWPDAYRANRWVRHASRETGATGALDDFVRFPRWMWRNTVVVDFLEWLWQHNARGMTADRVGFYGLDLYSLHASMDAVLRYLGKVDPDAAARARRRYSCFEQFGTDEAQSYGYAATLGLSRSCEDDVVAQLMEMQRSAADYASRDGRVAEDEHFVAEQNARLVRNAERYYRAMFGGQAVLRTSDARDALADSRLERAIGVVYKPETERASHYFRARLADQFDAVIHVDTTTALTPLERWSRASADLPETYPTGV